MRRERRALLELLASVADRTSIDLTDEESRRLPPRTLEGLRIISRIADRRPPNAVKGCAPEVVADSAVRVRHPDTGQPSHALWRWGLLEVRDRIGEGTFAEVYRAYYPKLEIEVALKLFKPGAGIDAGRALREARDLARVAHENVVRVYDTGTHDGRSGLWMELVRGRTLQQLVEERGTFSARETALAGQDICRGVAAVHAAGLIHGDIKPQNVVREDGGRLVLMDLGAGTRREAAVADSIAGTPMFLAPEVLAGGFPTRTSDVYSIAVLLYYLATGTYPYAAESIAHLRRLIHAGALVRLHDRRPDLSEGFVRIVERALSVSPTNRYQTAGEMQVALAATEGHAPVTGRTTWYSVFPQRTAALAVVALVGASATGVVTFVGVPWKTSVAVTRKDSVAVLPFRAIGSDPEIAYYSDGLADDLTAQISRLRSVRVVSGMSVRAYGESDRSASEIGRELNVAALVTGSIRFDGERLRLFVELVDSASGRVLWSQSFDRSRRDTLQIQDEISRQIGSALLGSPGQRPVRLDERRMDPRAFDLYLKGRFYWNRRTADGLRTSIGYFEQAIELAPDSPLAYAGLADAYNLQAFYQYEWPNTVRSEADTAVHNALRLDPDLPEAHAALGMRLLNQFRWKEAEVALTRAIELNPSLNAAHQWYALALIQQGRFEQARAEIGAAQQLDPASEVLKAASAYIHYASRDFATALDQYESILDVAPDDFSAYVAIIDAYAAAGDVRAAQHYLEQARSRFGASSELNVPDAYMAAHAGDADRARSILASMELTAIEVPISYAELASVYGVIGDAERAFDSLELALTTGDPLLGYAAVDPRYDPLRSDRRFNEILARIDLYR